MKTGKGILVMALLLAPAAIGWTTPAANNLVLQPQSRVWISGTSTVRSFDCSAKTVRAQVASSAGAAAAVLAGQKAVTSVALTIPAAQLDCQNGTMNEHMLRALKASEHPEIAFRLATYELAGNGDPTRVTLRGTLVLGGAERTIEIRAEARDGGDGALRVSGEHVVRMSEFGLRAPTLMMGTMRVHDPVTVHFDLYLKS